MPEIYEQFLILGERQRRYELHRDLKQEAEGPNGYAEVIQKNAFEEIEALALLRSAAFTPTGPEWLSPTTTAIVRCHLGQSSERNESCKPGSEDIFRTQMGSSKNQDSAGQLLANRPQMRCVLSY